jgi:hypothetical protein
MPWFRGASARHEDQFANEVIALVRAVLGLKAKRLADFALLIERRTAGRQHADTAESERRARQLPRMTENDPRWNR